MRSKQRPTPVPIMQMMQTRKTHRRPILRRRPTTHLVHDHERAWRRLRQDSSCLEHLNHEGGLVTEEVISRTDTAEDLIDDSEFCECRGHERADLG